MKKVMDGGFGLHSQGSGSSFNRHQGSGLSFDRPQGSGPSFGRPQSSGLSFDRPQGSKSSFHRPQGSGSDIPLIDEELLQRLEAVLNSAEDSFAPSQPLPSAQPLISPTLTPSPLNNFLPPVSPGSAQPEFRTITQEQATGAVFPQQVEIITGAPHQGFHQIR